MHIEFDITPIWALYALIYCVIIPFNEIVVSLILVDIINIFNEDYEKIVTWILAFLWPITLPISILLVCYAYIIDFFE